MSDSISDSAEERGDTLQLLGVIDDGVTKLLRISQIVFSEVFNPGVEPLLLIMNGFCFNQAQLN